MTKVQCFKLKVEEKVYLRTKTELFSMKKKVSDMKQLNT